MANPSPQTEPGSEAPNPSSARARFQARKSGTSTRSKPGPRATSPTRSMEPGVVHLKVAQASLRTVQRRVLATTGIELDIGEFPESSNGDLPPSEDPQRVVRLAARVVARMGDRLGITRRLSRHMEGTDKRAGILADLYATCVALYERNPEAVELLATRFATDLRDRRVVTRQKRQSRQTSSNGQPRQPEGVSHA